MKYSLAEIDIMRHAIGVIEYYRSPPHCPEIKHDVVESKLRTLMMNGTSAFELIDKVSFMLIGKPYQSYHVMWWEWVNDYETQRRMEDERQKPPGET